MRCAAGRAAPFGRLVLCLVCLGCLACSACTATTTKPLPDVAGNDNGELVKRPAAVLADARSALLGAASVHAVGDLELGGAGAVTVDLMLTHAGAVSGSLASGSRRLQVLRTMGDVPTAVVRGDPGLAGALGATPTAGAVVALAFVAVPAGAGTPVAGLSVQGLADLLLPAASPSASAPAAASVAPSPSARLGDVDGARAVVVTVGGATVSVSDDGPPRPLRIVGGAAVPGVLTFTDDVVLPLPTLPVSPGTLAPTP